MDAAELEAYDQYCAEVWSEDPDVEIVDAPLDQNAEHGSHTEAQLDKDAPLTRAYARLRQIVGSL